MKNNYNPFTVPENFFEDSCTKAIAKSRRCSIAIRCALSLALALILIIVPVCLKNGGQIRLQENDIASNQIAEVYDYDIFLQVNF